MRSLPLLAVVALSAVSLLQDACADVQSASDPILGRWRWFNHGAKVFHADGTVTPHGTWKCVSPNQDPRKYVIDWGKGIWIDTLYLRDHGTYLDGQNQEGHHVTASKLNE